MGVSETELTNNTRNETIKVDETIDLNILTSGYFNVFIKDEPVQSNWEWKSSNEDVAVVDADGIVTAKQIGYTTITGYSKEDDLKVRAIISVYNNKEGAIAVPQTAVGNEFVVTLKEDGTLVDVNGKLLKDNKLVMKDKKIMEAPKEDLIETMFEIINLVSDYDNGENSIGYSYYYYASTMYTSDTMKLLSVNGIEPSYENIQTGLYDIQTAYYAVIRKDEAEDSDTRKLLNAMMSERGQNVAKEAGYVQNY